MSDCKFCRHRDGGHAADCPRDSTGASECNNQGYRDVRVGKTSASNDPAYTGRFLRGIIALERAENDLR